MKTYIYYKNGKEERLYNVNKLEFTRHWLLISFNNDETLGIENEQISHFRNLPEYENEVSI